MKIVATFAGPAEVPIIFQRDRLQTVQPSVVYKVNDQSFDSPSFDSASLAESNSELMTQPFLFERFTTALGEIVLGNEQIIEIC